MVSWKKDHSAWEELETVHAKMKKTFLQKKTIKSDVAKAQKMQDWLYKIKNLDIENLSNDTIQQSLELQALIQIKEMAGQILQGKSDYHFKSSYIFKQGHFWKGAKSTSAAMGADDIAEADLYALLTAAGEMAVKKGKSSKLGVSLIGSSSAKISLSGSIDDIAKQMVNSLSDRITEKTWDSSEIINAPVARSGKADVSGYGKTIDIEADIKPEWQDFIRTFQGAKFSVKNYSSNVAHSLTIRLGQTNPFKAMYSTLTALGYNEKQATHIYMHARQSYLNANGPIPLNGLKSIMQLRFVYELTGAGLIDANTNQRLDVVDFLVYNDPASDKIFVKSTKAMIQDFEVSESSIGDPWHSEIVVLKQSFA